MNWVAAPFTGLTGVTEICGVMLRDQLSSMPVTPVRELVSLSVQVPATQGLGLEGFAVVICISTVLPKSAESDWAGWNVPVNGVVPVARVIEVSAASSKTVFVEFRSIAAHAGEEGDLGRRPGRSGQPSIPNWSGTPR